MKEMTVSDAMRLVKSKSGPAISLYVGTSHADRDGAGLITARLQRLYRSAEALLARTYDLNTRERLLQPLRRALAALRLTRAPGGVAIYHSENFTGLVRLPTPVEDLAVAADSFHLKPVFRTAQLRRSYYMLVLRKAHADLVRVTADETKRVDRFSLELQGDRRADGDSEVRGSSRDRLKIRRQRDIRSVMQILARQLDSYFQEERHPLLLAGGLRASQAFRAASTYPLILARTMTGHVEDIDTKSLVAMSTPIMEAYFCEVDRVALGRYRRAEAAGLGTTDLVAIAEAASQGRVQSLLISADRHVWGRFDGGTGEVEILRDRMDATADDLLDDIAELVLRKGGYVTVLPSHEMPRAEPIAAVMRWSDEAVAASELRPPPRLEPRPCDVRAFGG